ncbi:hypothetical protein BVRB_2g034420 isoform B [Beta vulgaris subsp. vulgaris]|nr:hypothetical protein BVRB_2g034420 isoform B [Beta vulgaris subsp. vulgaris]
MFALGEHLPEAPGARLLLLLGWLLIIVGVILLVSSTKLVRFLPGKAKRSARGGLDKSFSAKQPGLIRTRDPNPSAVIHANTLHHLLTSPTKEKP